MTYGTRQKIDEAPTPYRYHSESDQSEAESEASTGSEYEHHDPNNPPANRRKLKSKKISHISGTGSISFGPSISSPSSGAGPTSSSSSAYLQPASRPPDVLNDEWKELQAKLNYHQFLAEQTELYAVSDVAATQVEFVQGERRSCQPLSHLLYGIV